MFNIGKPDPIKLAKRKNIKGLIKALNYSKDPTVRKTAAVNIGEYKFAGCEEALINATNDPNINVVRESINALYKINPSVASEKSLSLFENGDKELKVKAAILAARNHDMLVLDWIGKTKDREIIETLLYNSFLPREYSLVQKAAHLGSLEIVEFLIGKKDVYNYEDIEPIFNDTFAGEAIINKLLENNKVNLKGNKLFKYGVHWGIYPLVVKILSETRITKKQITEGLAATFISSKSKSETSLKIAELLIEAGADVNANLPWIGPILHSAIGICQPFSAQYISLLIKNNVDINCTTKKGVSALEEAAYNGNPEAVKLLIENGIDLKKYGSKALAAARKKMYTQGMLQPQYHEIRDILHYKGIRC